MIISKKLPIILKLLKLITANFTNISKPFSILHCFFCRYILSSVKVTNESITLQYTNNTIQLQLSVMYCNVALETGADTKILMQDFHIVSTQNKY